MWKPWKVKKINYISHMPASKKDIWLIKFCARAQQKLEISSYKSIKIPHIELQLAAVDEKFSPRYTLAQIQEGGGHCPLTCPTPSRTPMYFSYISVFLREVA